MSLVKKDFSQVGIDYSLIINVEYKMPEITNVDPSKKTKQNILVRVILYKMLFINILL